MNPYYNPEEMGLTQIAELEWREPCYDFTLSVLWQHKDTGKFFAASDSGCSCPTPFEDFTTIESLTPINSLGDMLAFLRGAREALYEDASPAKESAFVSAYQGARYTA